MFVMPFESADSAEKRAESRARSVIERAVPWPEAKAPKGYRDLGVIAETYKIENPMDLVFPDTPVEEVLHASGIVSPDEGFRYCKKIFPKLEGLPVTPAPSPWMDHGRVFFTDDVVIPVLEYAQPAAGGYGWKAWMSLTPHEIWTQVSGIRAATKNVVIGGLGMGYLLQEAAKKKTVKKITVVEINREMIDWFGRDLVSAISDKYDKPIDLIMGDIWEYDFDPQDRVLIDIWDGFWDASFDRHLIDLRSEKKFVWAWGSSRGSRAW